MSKVTSAEMKATKSTRPMIPNRGRKIKSSRLALTNIELQASLDYMKLKRTVKRRLKEEEREREGRGDQGQVTLGTR